MIRKSLGRARRYVGRLRTWTQVLSHVTGEGPADRAALRRGFARAFVDAARELDQWRDPQVERDCSVVTSLGRFRVRARSDDLYIALPTREAAIVRVMQRRLAPGDCFVDAGANIGVYTVLGSRLVGASGRVIAIEMMSDTATILRSHLELNNCRNVEVVEAALSDQSGRTVKASVEPGKFGSASIVLDRGAAGRKVTTTTLNQVLGAVSNIKLLKMDLEGAERQAVRAMPVDRIEAVIFEDRAGGELREWFASKGFSIERLDGANSLAVRT
jgi:FkbM family methyltransferase